LKFLIQDNKKYNSAGTMPGSHTIITAGDGFSLNVGSVDGDFKLIEHGVSETDFTAFEPTTYWGLDKNHLLCANIFKAVLLNFDGSTFKIVREWDLLSKKVFASQLKIAADKSGNVFACIAADYIHRLKIEGESSCKQVTDKDFWGLAVSFDGSKLATGRRDGRLEFRDGKTLEVTEELKPCNTPLLAIAFSPDGSQLAFSDDSWQLFLMDMANKEITSLPTVGKVIGLHYLSDGRLVAVNLSRVVRIFDGKDIKSEWNITKELGDRYIQGSAVLGDESGIVLACEQKGVAFLSFNS
jgi:WD40 repeat protein